MNKDNDNQNKEETPVCEKCGNVKIRESFGDAQDKPHIYQKGKDEAWMCPHCQGEIDFFGDDEK